MAVSFGHHGPLLPESGRLRCQRETEPGIPPLGPSKALERRKPACPLPHHPIRGFSIVIQYPRIATRHGVIPSMSRKGNRSDNAVMESFFKTLKTELIGRKYKTQEEVKLSLFVSIEGFYNSERLFHTGVEEKRGI